MVFTSFFSLFGHPLPARAAAKTWDGGCGANTNWSCAANWSGDTVPASGDTLTFNGTSTNNSTVDALFNPTETISSLTISAGYTGTITLTTTLHISGNYSQATGTFNAAAQTFDMNGSFTLSGGTFTASSGSTTLAGAMSISGTPTFNNNSGTFTFDGSTTASLSCNSVVFNLVTFAQTSGTKTVSSNCTLPLGNNPSAGAGGSISSGGTLSGTGTLTTTGTLALSSGSGLSGFSGISTSTLSVSGATFNASTYSTFSVSSAFNFGSGSFIAPSGTMSVSGAFSVTGGSFSANGGIVNFNGTSTVSIDCNGIVFNLVTFTNTSGTKTIGSGCNLPLGNNPTIGSGSTVDFTLNGTLSGTGTLTVASTVSGNALTLSGSGLLSGFTGLNAGSFASVGTTLNFSDYSTFSINGSYNQTTGSIKMPSGTASISGAFTISLGGTLDANGGTILFNGGGTTACNNVTFNLIQINYSGTGVRNIGSDCQLPLGNNPTIGGGRLTSSGTLSGTGTLSFTANLGPTFTISTGGALSGFTGLQVNGGFVVGGGTVDLSSYTTVDLNGADGLTLSSGTLTAPALMTIEGALSFVGGTFLHNNGTVNFDGIITTSLACNFTSFNLVTFTNTAGVKTVGSDCNLPLGNNPTMGIGTTADYILNGTLSGTGNLTIASAGSGNILTVNNAGSLSGFTGLSAGSLTTVNATLDFSSFSLFTLGGTYTQTGGLITMPSANVDFPSTVTLNSGTFIAPNGTMYVEKALTINPAAGFNANSGTVEFSGGAATISCGGETFNIIKFTNIGTKIFNSDCSFELGNNPTFSNSGDITLNGNFNGTGTLTFLSSSSLLTIGGANALTGFNGLSIGGSVTIASTINVDFSNFSSVTILHNFSQGSSSNFIASTGVMSIGGDFTVNTNLSTFDANEGTLNFYATSYQTIVCGGATLNLVTLTNTLNTVQLMNGCNLPLGNNPTTGTGQIVSYGTLSGSGTLTTGGALTIAGCAFCGDGSISGFTGLNVGTDFTTDYVSNDFSAYNTLDINRNFLVTNTGSFTATTANMTVGGNFTIDAGSTFNANGSTVILDGSNQIIMGTTFNNLTKIAASADTLTFPAGGTETILGNLILKGGSATELLMLVSSSPGTPWQIDAQGSRTLQYLDVSDSNNINASVMTAYDSVNGGGNTYWSFQDTPVPPAPTPTPTPVSPAITTIADNENRFLLHPADAIEGTVTIVTGDVNKQDNAGRTNKSANRTYVYLWWSSFIGALLLASLTAYILYANDKKKRPT